MQLSGSWFVVVRHISTIRKTIVSGIVGIQYIELKSKNIPYIDFMHLFRLIHALFNMHSCIKYTVPACFRLVRMSGRVFLPSSPQQVTPPNIPKIQKSYFSFTTL